MIRIFRLGQPGLYAMSAILLAASTTFNPVSVSDAFASCSANAGSNVDWQDCRKRNLIMSGTNFSGSNFSRADLSSSDLSGSNLKNSIFYKTNLLRTSLANTQAQGADFAGAIAYRTNFANSDLTGSNFSKAEITRADFSKTIVKNIDMSKGEISRVNFTDAEVEDVTFEYTNLSRTDFRGSNLNAGISMQNAFLFRTRFEGMDLSNVTGLEAWQLKMACGNAATVLPEGMEHPENWPCVEETD